MLINLPACRFKLSLFTDFKVNCCLNGIHFNFAAREFPDVDCPEMFVTKLFLYKYGPFVKENCDKVYNHRPKLFGTFL